MLKLEKPNSEVSQPSILKQHAIVSRQLSRYRKYELESISNLKIWWFRNTKEKTPEKLLVIVLVLLLYVKRDFHFIQDDRAGTEGQTL